jgi:hypothetical protein
VTAPPPVITPPIAQVAMPCGEVSFDATRPGSIDPVMLANAGHILLERVRAVYAEAGVPLPDRQLWTAGESAYDCEQLVVSLMSLTAGGLPTSRGVIAPNPVCDPFIVANFEITVVRCVPTPNDKGTPPRPEAIATAADITSTDAFILIKAACRFDLWNAQPLFTPFNYDPGGGMEVESSLQVETAQGGMQAVSLTIRTVIG